MVLEADKNTNWEDGMDYTRDELEKFLAALHKIKKDGPDTKSFGICANCQNLADPYGNLCYRIVEYFSPDWAGYSGNIQYPVPGKYWASANLWNRRTKYGRLRWELLDYLIERVKEELNGEGEGYGI